MKLLDLALVLFINLLWGFTFIAGKVGLQEMPAVWFTGLRFVMLIVLLAPWLRVVPAQMKRILAISVFCGALHFCLMYSALKLAADVSTVAIATQLTLPFSVILAVAMLSMALAQVLMRGLRDVGIFNLQAWVALVSAPALLAMSLLIETGQFEAMAGASLTGWAALAYTAIGSSLIGFAGMYYLLRRYPVSLVTPMFLLAPIFAVIFGVTLLGDVLTVRVMIGAAITLLGVLVVTLAPSVKPAKPA